MRYRRTRRGGTTRETVAPLIEQVQVTPTTGEQGQLLTGVVIYQNIPWPSPFEDVQWYRNAVPVVGATDHTYLTTEGGSYELEATASNSAGEDGPVLSNAAVITAVDTTAPVLSSPTDAAAGDTTATGSVTTDEGNGTLYWVVSTSATVPSAAQVKAGQDHTGAAAVDSGSQAVSATGVQTLSPAPSGLTAGTPYTIHFMHEDAATNQSTVASGDGFTTAVPWTPSAMFTSAEKGSLYEPKQGVNMWTDVARTTLVTGSSNYASIASDINGHYAEQATVPNQPSFMDSIWEGIDDWLEFPGVDDFLILNAGERAAAQAVAGFTIGVAAKFNTITGILYKLSTNFAAQARVMISASNSNSTLLASGRRSDSNSLQAVSAPITTSAFYALALFDFANATLKLRVNGVEVASLVPFQTAANTSNTLSAAGGIGGTTADSSFFHGRMNSVGTIARIPNAGEIASWESYLAAKAEKLE